MANLLWVFRTTVPYIQVVLISDEPIPNYTTLFNPPKGFLICTTRYVRIGKYRLV